MARNRIRRVAREVFRLVQRELPALDFVVSARSAAREASRAELHANLSRLLTTVGELMRGLIKAIIQTYQMADQSAARTELPLLSDVLCLRARSARSSRRAAWQLARGAPTVAGVTPSIREDLIRCRTPLRAQK